MEELISLARNGDPDAFTALMESQMQNMYKAARSVLCNDEDIEMRFRIRFWCVGRNFPS